MTCIRCGALTEAGDNRLLLTFSGGYGDFIDRVPPEGPIEAVLCGICAHSVLYDQPWMVGALRLRCDPTDALRPFAGHNTGCYCWEGSQAERRFDEAYERQGVKA